MSVFAVIAAAALADNIVLAKMLGLCPFAALSKRLDIALGAGLATLAVITFSAAAAFAVSDIVPAALLPITLIAVVAVMVSAAELMMRLWAPLMHRVLGIYLPLIATNCAVLGVLLLLLRRSPASVWEAMGLGAGGGLGFLLAVAMFALIRERMTAARVPPLLRGAPLTMISAGFMALAFSGLAGL